MVLMSKCKPSLCVLDTEIKSSYTRLGGNSVLRVIYFVNNGADHRPTSANFPLARIPHPGQTHPSAFDFFLLKVNELFEMNQIIWSTLLICSTFLNRHCIQFAPLKPVHLNPALVLSKLPAACWKHWDFFSHKPGAAEGICKALALARGCFQMLLGS